MGDALWTPGRYVLWGGYGHRTDKEVYHYISDVLSVPIIALRLEKEDFYHLDTAYVSYPKKVPFMSLTLLTTKA